MAKIRICLDAGHCGKKYNKSPVVPEYYESDMVWKLHILLKKYLEQYGFEVGQTRKSQSVDMDVVARGKAAKGYDLFLSLHSNACDSESVDRPVGIYLVDDNCGKIDETSKEIAIILSRTVAEVMCTSNSATQTEKKSSNDRDGDGKKNDDYYGVLYGSHQVGVPGIILEHSFHTNKRAAKWLLDENNLDKLAKEEAAVIAKFYGVETSTKEETQKSETTQNAATKPLYRVQVGAFREKPNAKALVNKLEKAGFEAIIVSNGAETPTAKKSVAEIAKEVINGLWGNGEAQKKKLTDAGYDFEAVQAKVNELLK